MIALQQEAISHNTSLIKPNAPVWLPVYAAYQYKAPLPVRRYRGGKLQQRFSLLKWLIGLLLFLLLLSPIIAPPLFIELGGATAQGQIIAKRETISVLAGTWS